MFSTATKTCTMSSPFRRCVELVESAGAKAPSQGFCGSSTQIYGENFFEMRDYWGTDYKFNAKPACRCAGHRVAGRELDSETGMYYYGARYYTPELSIWLSVDPLSDKYPSMSPFMYCAGNPVIFIDPNGMEVVNPYTERRNNSEERRNQAKNNLDSFGGNRRAEGYRDARREYRQANRQFNQIDSKFQKVETAISDVKKYNNDLWLYSKLNMI